MVLQRTGGSSSAPVVTASQLKTPQRAVAVNVKVALRKVLGLNLKVEGLTHLPGDGQIIAHNLVSPLDAFLVALALTEAGHASPVILLDYEMARIPLLTSLLSAGAVSVDSRVGPSGDDDPFGMATKALWDGRSVISAPEQVVSTSLEVLPIRSGPVRLSVAAKAPLVPTATFGAHRLIGDNGRVRLVRGRGTPIAVTFGSPTPPPEASGDFLTSQRMLQYDLEALLARTLDDYDDREEGEAGADWWPAARGGSAPSLIDTLEAVDAPTPTIELWADDRTVAQTRKAMQSTTVPVAPDVFSWTMEDDDEDEAVVTLDVPEREPLPDPVPLAEWDIGFDFTYIKPMPAEVNETPLVDTSDRLSVGVTGMLAFDLPGMPRKVLRKTRIEAQPDGSLAVMSDDRALLVGVTVERRPTQTLFRGTLTHEYNVTSGDLSIDVPAGTQATLTALRGQAPEVA